MNIKLEFNKFLEDATTTTDVAIFARPLVQLPVRRNCCNGTLINEKKKKKIKKKRT